MNLVIPPATTLYLIEGMAGEIVKDERGGMVLRKARRLIGTFEAAVVKAALRATLQ